jgi:alpha-soluble NSF attachment protein
MAQLSFILVCLFSLFFFFSHIQCQSKHEAASAFQNAATCFTKVNPTEAISCLIRATEFYVDQGRFQAAAKQHQQIGELLEEQGDMEQALEHFTTAADYYEGEGQNSAANKVKLKVADYYALNEKYEKAIEIYEALAVVYLANNLLKWSAKDLFFKAAICHLCCEDLIAAKRAMERYQDLDVTFSSQRECKFLLKMIEACENYDADGLTIAIRDHNSITPLDNWKTTLLLRVKNSIAAEGQNEDMT